MQEINPIWKVNQLVRSDRDRSCLRDAHICFPTLNIPQRLPTTPNHLKKCLVQLGFLQGSGSRTFTGPSAATAASGIPEVVVSIFGNVSVIMTRLPRPRLQTNSTGDMLRDDNYVTTRMRTPSPPFPQTRHTLLHNLTTPRIDQLFMGAWAHNPQRSCWLSHKIPGIADDPTTSLADDIRTEDLED